MGDCIALSTHTYDYGEEVNSKLKVEVDCNDKMGYLIIQKKIMQQDYAAAIFHKLSFCIFHLNSVNINTPSTNVSLLYILDGACAHAMPSYQIIMYVKSSNVIAA